MQMLALVSMLASYGCGLPCASGVIANFQKESGLNPSMVGSSGIGLASWYGPRRNRLIATYGRGWSDARNQVAFAVTELREIGLLDRLWRSTDPGEAARLFMHEYERPRDRNPQARMRLAREIYREMSR